MIKADKAYLTIKHVIHYFACPNKLMPHEAGFIIEGSNFLLYLHTYGDEKQLTT